MQFLSVRTNFIKYVRCIFVGIPVWFTIGILVTLATEFAEALGVEGEVIGSKAVMYHYIGASAGAFLTGFISQKLRSRKKALLIALSSLSVMLCVLFLSHGVSNTTSVSYTHLDVYKRQILGQSEETIVGEIT